MDCPCKFDETMEASNPYGGREYGGREGQSVSAETIPYTAVLLPYTAVLLPCTVVLLPCTAVLLPCTAVNIAVYVKKRTRTRLSK